MPLIKFTNFIYIFFFLIVGFQTHWSQAQVPYFESHTIPMQGEGEVAVSCMYQDSRAFLWLGTEKGLFRFDGKDYRHYLLADSTLENHVYTLAESPEGTLWVGYASGDMAYLSSDSLIRFEPKEGTPVVEITGIAFTPDSTLWISTYGEGVYYYRNERMYNIMVDDDGLGDDYTYSLLPSKDGKGVWVATDGGISFCSLENGEKEVQTYSSDNGLPDNIVRSLAWQGDSVLWLGMEDEGVVQFYPEEKTFVTLDNLNDWDYGAVSSILFIDDNVWLATPRKGIISLDLWYNTVQIYDQTKGLNTAKINALLQDREHNVWVATPSGFLRSPGERFSYLKQIEGLNDRNFSAVFSDSKHRLWVANTSGFFQIEGHDLADHKSSAATEHLAQFDPLNIISIHEDRYGFLWLGSYGQGLFRFHPETKEVKHFTQEDTKVASDEIFSITSRNDTVWCATLGGILYFHLQEDASDPSYTPEFQSFTREDGLASNFIYYAYPDKTGRVWFATDGQGLSCYTNGTFKTYGENEGLVSGVIYSIAEDGNQHIWFSTADAGVYRYDGKEFFQYTTENGLKDLSIRSIMSDSLGNMLIAHHAGVERYDIYTNEFYSYGKEVGLQGITPTLNAWTKDAKGQIWVGTQEGIVRFRPEIHHEDIHPKVQIESIQLLLREINIDEEISFPHNQNHFTFNYLALWHTDPHAIEFRYQLEGYDLDWIVSMNESSTYSSLPPGNYSFKVSASINKQFARSEIASYSFTIKPPFWQTTWFLSLSILTVIVGISAFIKVRENNLRQAKEELEKQVRQRTSEILHQKEEIESQKDQLAEKSSSLEKAFREIEIQNQKITSSIQYAKRIQESILPEEAEFKELFPNSFIFYRPKDIVSGDFYWVKKKGAYTYIAVVDCTGHGVPGALMSIIGSTLFNEIVSHTGALSPAQILTLLNMRIKHILGQKGNKNSSQQTNDGMDAAICRIHRKEQKMLFAGAKRPMYLHDGEKFIIIRGNKLGIGGHKHPTNFKFQDSEIELVEGSNFYLFTDGFPDQFGGEFDRKYLTHRFRQLIENIQKQPFEGQYETLNKELSKWQGKTKQTDDILVVGFKI